MSEIIDGSPEEINTVHVETGMSAMMLAASGGLSGFVRKLGEHAYVLDFSHRDLSGRDLLDCAMLSDDPEVIEQVLDLFNKYAPYVLNNPPEPPSNGEGS